MLYMPFYYLFLTSLIFSTLVSMSSSNWLFVWGGLEMNLLCFIPIVVCTMNHGELESALKYFLVQALGSSLILLGSFIYMSWIMSLISSNFGTCLMLTSMMIKLGMFPFHYWLPHVMGGLSWISCILLSTWQKLGPLFIMSSVIENVKCWVVLLVGCMSSLIGGLGGLNQSQIRILLAYSSIGHLGWMFVGMLESLNLVFQYFVVYTLMNLSIMGFLHFIPSSLVSFNSYSLLPGSFSIYMCVMFLSLGGLPPFIGFYPKLMILSGFVGGNFLLVPIFILVLGSLLSIFYYLNIFISVFMKSYISGFNSSFFNISFFLSFIMSLFFAISMSGLFLLI